MKVVIDPNKLVWQSDTAKSYLCVGCGRWLRTQYEGDLKPSVVCRGAMQPHILEWTEQHEVVRHG